MLAVKRQGDADFSRGPNYDESCIRCMENINTYDGDEQVWGDDEAINLA